MKQLLKRIILTSLTTTLIISLLTNACLFEQPSTYAATLNDEGNNWHVRSEWKYKDKRWTYEVDIPVTLYEHLKATERSTNYGDYAINDLDDDWLGYTATSFKEQAEQEGWGFLDTVNFVLSFAQNVPYTGDAETTGYNEYPRYPIETIVDEGGDCEDTVVLFITILKEMGYDVALLLFASDEHMAAGVHVTQQFLADWDEDYSPKYYVAQNGKNYAYCDTTFPGWRPGEQPPKIKGSANIVPIE